MDTNLTQHPLPQHYCMYKTLTLSDTNKLNYFINRHSTKEGTWGKLTLHKGNIQIIFMDGEDQVYATHALNADHPEIIIPPAAWHKIELTDGQPFSATIQFYCAPHRFFEKKHHLTQVHPDLLYAYQVYLSHQETLHILDIGCGRGRNALFMAQAGHHVTGIDIDGSKLDDIKPIIKQEKLDQLTLIQADISLENSIVLGPYDFVVSTMSLPFLPSECIERLLQALQASTSIGGKHFFVFPIADNRYIYPDTFTFVPDEKTLYEYYQNSGWSILEYKINHNLLGNVDDTGKPIKGRFGLLLAQRTY